MKYQGNSVFLDLKRLFISLSTFTFICCSTDKEILDTTTSKPLILLGFDISESFGAEKIPPQYLKELCEQIAAAGDGGLVGVYPIGNPNENAFIRCKLFPYPIQNSQATLSEQGRQVKEIKKIKALNTRQIDSFVQLYQQTVYQKGNQSETDIQRFLNKAISLANEPIYANYTKSIFIYSDGKHDVGGKHTLILPSEEKLADIRFYGSGLQNSDLITKLGIEIYESPEGYLEAITHFYSSNNKEEQ